MILIKDGTQTYYNDWDAGQPVVFSHGGPVSVVFHYQMFFLASRAEYPDPVVLPNTGDINLLRPTIPQGIYL
jgi:hypothetical protein